MAELSVIITAFNVEKYIKETLESVISQSLKNIEIIVVDDCSTDKTYDIITSFADKDSRIRVIRHEKNSSVSLARKHGIEAATGKYMMFLDGDDMLAKRACETALLAIELHKVDVLQFDTMLFTDSKGKISPEFENSLTLYLKSPQKKIVAPSDCGLIDADEVPHPINFTVWNKIYRAEIVKKAGKNIPDEHLNLAEDVLMSYLIQFFAHSFISIPKKLHCYRIGSGITTTKQLSDGKLDAFARCIYIYNYLRDWTLKQGCSSAYKKNLNRIKDQMYGNVYDVMFRQLEPMRKNHFFNLLQKYSTVEQIILFLYTAITNVLGVAPINIIEECSKFNISAQEKDTAKTIGLFYYRIHNGGIESVISTLCKIWSDSGYRVVLFTDEPAHNDDYAIPSSVVRVVLPTLEKRNTSSFEARICEFRNALIENDVDLLVYNAWLNRDLLLDEMIIKSCGVKLCIHTHGLFCADATSADITATYRNATLGAIYHFADSVIALNEADAAWWRAQDLRTFKTVNPIKLPLDVETSKLSGNNVLLLGRISPEKQIVDALKIIELVKNQVPDVKLTIVGKADIPAYDSEVRDYVREHKLTSNIVFAGFHTDVLPFYQSSDLLLSTSMYEGFSQTLTEGKLCGLPLVAYILPNWDLTRENLGMVSVPQGDIEAAADAIAKILLDPELKKQMGKEARESAEKLLSIDFAKHWDHIFKETMKPKEKERPISEKTYEELAISIAVKAYANGIWLRNFDSAIGGAAVGGNAQFFVEQNNILRLEIDKLANSESYRIGLMITAIPRAVKRFFKKIFRRR